MHFHAHSHAGEIAPHARTAHAHEHGFRWRTLLVGLMHGMAGSAALLVLTVSQASSPAVGLGYVALFGIGSMIGMGALSTLIAVPLAVTARWLTFANHGLQAAVGAATIAIGIRTIVGDYNFKGMARQILPAQRIEAAAQDRAHVVVLAPDSAKRLGLLRPDDGSLRLLRLTEKIRGVALLDRLELVVAARDQTLPGILAHRLQQSIAGLARVLLIEPVTPPPPPITGPHENPLRPAAPCCPRSNNPTPPLAVPWWRSRSTWR